MVVCTLVKRARIVEINNSILEVNPFHVMYLLAIALHQVHSPHRHLHCLFQFTPSHTISLRTVLLFILRSTYTQIFQGVSFLHTFSTTSLFAIIFPPIQYFLLPHLYVERVSELIRLSALKSNSTPFRDRKYESGAALMETSVLPQCVNV